MSTEEMKLRKREEYEMQHFGFHSRAAYDGIKGIILEEIESVCQKLCKSIENKYKPGPEELSILRTEAKWLAQTYESRVEAHMGRLNKIIRKIIAVPSHLLLMEDKFQAVQISQNELDDMRCKLEKLQTRAKRAAMFNAALHQELEVQRRFEAVQDAINKSSEEIKSNIVHPNLDNISKFMKESEKLSTEMVILESINGRKIDSPVIENLKSLEAEF